MGTRNKGGMKEWKYEDREIWREREKEIYLENRRKGYKQKERQEETEVGRERKAERCWSKKNESDSEGIRENERVVRWESVAKYFYEDFSVRMHYDET